MIVTWHAFLPYKAPSDQDEGSRDAVTPFFFFLIKMFERKGNRKRGGGRREIKGRDRDGDRDERERKRGRAPIH